ncbi:hypothetical protein S40285_10097 [Stachybotrys chlorohalonatus IBT 40285]|uniref:Uncharacterized protein n=1 Tax=Stachybotrys chlorohalonatus (strain IBT 40285) TaxID=1283841 RepID=A0A084R1N3_STAC4|nr:hypothetical protein S40285_10097 [Stachybotrys chlorohalonata IBT 40285]
MCNSTTNTETSFGGDNRNLKHLQHLWTEHILNAAESEETGYEPDTEASNNGALIAQDEIAKMRGFLQKAVAKSVAREKAEGNEGKARGACSAGRKGVSETGVVMNRDTGDTSHGGGLDHTYMEPGSYFESGDLEVWVTWHGWSRLTIPDGRWRPGFHYEILLCQFSTVINYRTNRKFWRALDKPWIICC